VDGIAVGLSTKVLPHNFCELIEASIGILKRRKPNLYPDFPTGGYIDVSNYNGGEKGGKVRIRARIEEKDKKTLLIKDIPFGTTTTSVIDSIIKANDSGKIKIKKVVDNTAKDVEIEIQLQPGIDPDITIDALYAFTDCEVSISPNACVIIDDKPHFLSVNEILRISTEKTVELLRQELEIKKKDLMEKLLYSSLEKIFIEKRIYRNIEECKTWEDVLATIDKGLKPYKKQFYREITQDDIIRLTEIKIKRISRYDSFKADELMKNLEKDLKETKHHLANLTDFAIAYFQDLLKKYGKGKERKTEIRTFDTISASVVALANQKLYINRAEGFIGYGLKKDEYICDCSDLDDIVVFRKDGVVVVKKIGEKVFVGKDIIHAAVFKKNDDLTTYNMIYVDGGSGVSYAKRFPMGGVIRDKEYDLTKGNKGSKVHYFSANPNGEAEIVAVTLTPSCSARIKVFDFDFSTLEVKGRSSMGNIVTKYPVKKVSMKQAGVSIVVGTELWYDDIVGRLNKDGRGKHLGTFEGDDKILVLYNDGSYELTSFELTNRYDPPSVAAIEKFNPERIISAVHMDGESSQYYVKRFKIETTTVGKKFPFISESPGSKLMLASLDEKPQVKVDYGRGKSEVIRLDQFIEVKGWKAIGNKLPSNKISAIKLIEKEMAKEGLFAVPPVAPKKDILVNVSKKNSSKDQETGKAKDVKTVKGKTDKKVKGKKEVYGAGTTIELDFKPKKK
jgi:topoisomerase-4 subunit A